MIVATEQQTKRRVLTATDDVELTVWSRNSLSTIWLCASNLTGKVKWLDTILMKEVVRPESGTEMFRFRDRLVSRLPIESYLTTDRLICSLLTYLSQKFTSILFRGVMQVFQVLTFTSILIRREVESWVPVRKWNMKLFLSFLFPCTFKPEVSVWFQIFHSGTI